MKKLLILTIFISLTVTQAQSQALIALIFGKSLTGPKFDMGLQLGANLSYILNSKADKPLCTFAFGAFTNYKFHKKWNLNTFFTFKSNRGVNYLDTVQVFNHPVDTSGAGVSVMRRLSYIDIAPEIQYKVSPSFAIGLGPVLSILTLAKDYYESGNKDKKSADKYNIYKNMNPVDFGLVVDLQFTFQHGEGISLNLKYIQGFLSPYKDESIKSNLNTVVNLGVGIPIRGSKKEKPAEKG